MLASTSLQAAAEPLAISCPNKQTTILTGTGAPPNESLIAYMSARPVGGGSSRSDGSWRIPLLVNERPDAYLVEVKVRGTRTLIGSFTCYVDIPLETATTTAPEDATGAAGESPTATTADIVPTRTPASSATATVTPQAAVIATATRTRTASAGTATATSTSTTPTPTTTSQASNAKIKISDLYCQADPENEYIELRNDSTTTVNMLGWKVINETRLISYTFPSYTMEAGPDFYLTLYSGSGNGDNLPEFAEFYWGRTDQLWNIDDRAELRDPAGNLVDAYIVPADNCN